MARINVTYDGVSADLPGEVDYAIESDDVKRIAVEVIRSGGVPGLQVADLNDNAFQNYVVDRFDTEDAGQKIFLRPKVPFGR